MKQTKVGGKERLGCPALMLEQKRDFILFRSTAEKDLFLFCFKFILFRFTANNKQLSLLANSTLQTSFLKI